MAWTISIGRVGGTVVRLHWTFLLFLAWIGIAFYAQSGLAAAVGGVTFLLLLFLCVVLHEFGHILAARYFGVRTPDVVLLPIGGMSRMERIPDEPRQELLIAIAGPAVSLAIALVLIIILGGLPSPLELRPEIAGRSMLAQLAWANLMLLAFNLLPAFPMDGLGIPLMTDFRDAYLRDQMSLTGGRRTFGIRADASLFETVNIPLARARLRPAEDVSLLHL